MKHRILATAVFVLLTAGAAWAVGGRHPAPTSTPATAVAPGAPAAAPSLALADALGTPAPVWLSSDCCQAFKDCLAACPPPGQPGRIACIGACYINFQGCSC